VLLQRLRAHGHRGLCNMPPDISKQPPLDGNNTWPSSSP
jgi:hypothetical protein